MSSLWREDEENEVVRMFLLLSGKCQEGRCRYDVTMENEAVMMFAVREMLGEKLFGVI